VLSASAATFLRGLAFQTFTTTGKTNAARTASKSAFAVDGVCELLGAPRTAGGGMQVVTGVEDVTPRRTYGIELSKKTILISSVRKRTSQVANDRRSRRRALPTAIGVGLPGVVFFAASPSRFIFFGDPRRFCH
jgi:hypothetical protein